MSIWPASAVEVEPVEAGAAGGAATFLAGAPGVDAIAVAAGSTGRGGAGAAAAVSGLESSPSGESEHAPSGRAADPSTLVRAMANRACRSVGIRKTNPPTPGAISSYTSGSQRI